MCTDFNGVSKEVPPGRFIPDVKTVVSRLRLCVSYRQQQSFARFDKKARRYTVPVEVQDCPKPAKPHVQTSLDLGPPLFTSLTVQIVHQQLSGRNVPSFQRLGRCSTAARVQR